ncbi:sporulation integral membrane protein YlbJ [Salirhabdus salicampi]|uniref:sporulation integral membrane protein YlbJ n=1 Tax=Salirhabdus salicampi TaxID=476102 RepID=UPI0020C5168A|nr:sporulation integral membrane protein YlbJ [Salirhabdus salicampi]MCP8616624.1 sporulation integral membrane protein YlbJ [Salirhabdus salicampi]
MKSKLKSLVLAAAASFVAFSIIKFPDQSLEASLRGLTLWWEIVFPSLLPFFITSELLIAFGVVKFFGILCEPIMRPLFNVPGAGSFVWAMGMASGYPSGAKLTARLRQERQLSRIEAERLVAFTNASNPLFIFGAISVGFFHDPQLGVLLATCHYVGNFLVGITMRFHGKNHPLSYRRKDRFSFKRAFYALHETRIRDGRPFGKVFGDSVITSIQTLLMIGGFIIIFSVLNKLLFLVGITPFIATFFQYILSMLGFSADLSIPFISGLFEITLGAQMIAQTEQSTLLQQVIIVCFILAFNGFSVQAQVASILSETDIRFAPYFFARILHGIYASLLALILFQPLYSTIKTENVYDLPVSATPTTNVQWENILHFLHQFGPVFTMCSLMIGMFILLNRTFLSK